MNNLIHLSETVTNGYTINSLNLISLASVLLTILVIISKNPIVSVLFLIGLFFSIACYLILLDISFIGLSYLLVYVGAVSILFLFILMLINVRVSELVTENTNSIPLVLIIAILFSYPVQQTLSTNTISAPVNSILAEVFDNIRITHFDYINDYLAHANSYFYITSKLWDGNLVKTTHIASIGNIMYTNYSMWLIITSIILLLAMVGTIVITIRSSTSVAEYQYRDNNPHIMKSEIHVFSAAILLCIWCCTMNVVENSDHIVNAIDSMERVAWNSVELMAVSTVTALGTGFIELVANTVANGVFSLDPVTVVEINVDFDKPMEVSVFGVDLKKIVDGVLSAFNSAQGLESTGTATQEPFSKDILSEEIRRDITNGEINSNIHTAKGQKYPTVFSQLDNLLKGTLSKDDFIPSKDEFIPSRDDIIVFPVQIAPDLPWEFTEGNIRTSAEHPITGLPTPDLSLVGTPRDPSIHQYVRRGVEVGLFPQGTYYSEALEIMFKELLQDNGLGLDINQNLVNVWRLNLPGQPFTWLQFWRIPMLHIHVIEQQINYDIPVSDLFSREYTRQLEIRHVTYLISLLQQWSGGYIAQWGGGGENDKAIIAFRVLQEQLGRLLDELTSNSSMTDAARLAFWSPIKNCVGHVLDEFSVIFPYGTM